MLPVRSLTSRFVPFVLAGAMLLVGCWEQRQRIVVNPDGSARIEVERKLSGAAARQMDFGGQTDLEEAARQQAADIVQGVRGVEAWTDVEWSAANDTLRFSGTAYVPDLADYAFQDPGAEDDRTITSIEVDRTGRGLTIEMGPSGEEEDEEEPIGSLTEEQAMEQARQLQSETRRMQAVMATFFAGMEETVALELPAEPTGVEGFERQEDGAWAVTFHGDTLLAAMRGVLEMETAELAARLREAGSAGQTRDEFMGDFLEERLGTFPARVEVPAGGEPRFDYEAEVAAAREAYEAVKERLGIQGDGGADEGAGTEPSGGAAPAEPAAGDEGGGGGDAVPAAGDDTGGGGQEVEIEGPPRAVRLSVGHPELTGSLELGTKLVISLPGAAGVRRLGLATDGPRGLSITDDTGRDLVAASEEAHATWEETHPNTFTSRGVATWSLTTVGDDPEVPAVEIELWATPSAGATSLRVRGEVPVRTPPTSTATASVPANRIEDGAELTLGGHTVTLSHYGTMTRGEERSSIYRVEGDVIVTAVRRGDETLWEMGGRGRAEIALPEDLAGGEPLVFEYGEAAVRRVPVDLRFGLGLGPGSGGA